jgi:hypothetical protein
MGYSDAPARYLITSRAVPATLIVTAARSPKAHVTIDAACVRKVLEREKTREGKGNTTTRAIQLFKTQKPAI